MQRFLSACALLIGIATVDAVTANPIPEDLQAIKITATGTLSPQYALVHLFAEKGSRATRSSMAVDASRGITARRTIRSAPIAARTATSCSWTRATASWKSIATAESFTS